MKKPLLIGCGKSRTKLMGVEGESTFGSSLVTLDHNPDHAPDFVHDLESFPYPFADNEFDEIHAYEVLEHTGRQGDWKFFFAQFEEFYRILKPGGMMFITVPKWDNVWAWADPSHTRVLPPETLVFLDQRAYDEQVGFTTMSDFRHWYKGNFKTISIGEFPENMRYVLQAVK